MALRITLIVAGLALVFLLVRAFLEPASLSLTKVFLPFTVREGEKTGLALRVLFFSDLHLDLLRLDHDRLHKAVLEQEPDLILFGGDLAANPARQKEAALFLAGLSQRPGREALPLMAVPGNHDTAEGLAAMAGAGITVLQNETALFSCRGRTWQIIGLKDKKHGQPDLAAAGLDPAVPVRQNLVLSHNPDNILDLSGERAAYFLAGHFHGGQIWLPFRWEFYLLRDELLPRQGIYKGIFTYAGLTAFITRGIGCVLVPLRLFSRPELVCLEFFGTRQAGGGPAGGSL